ncbi:MAG: valine--tRNA ligase [Synergistetes bacterium]|nr:valine--tRNA ligase [Synergistota bacterium]
MEPDLPRSYDPSQVEEKWYSYWLKKGYFHSEVDPSREKFSVVIPPPNVTGSLHMGHALNNTIQDIFVRWRRMQGYNTMWLPGTDHAGIATQNVVEKALAQEGLTKEELGREKFLKKVWEWKEKYGGRIILQLKRLGASCDWDRERFTLDEGLSRAVREVFVRLFREGLIYRGNYIINWCPRCGTALSDIEVEHQEVNGKLWYVRYPIVGEEGNYIVVATTRPETILGDVAVAVHPDDKRYKELVGKRVRIPLTDRIGPIISDNMVDPSFGTGAVKITPAHDPNDFLVAQRHNLPLVKVMNPDATMNEDAGERYKGLDRFECRERIVEDLEKEGLLERVEDYVHAVGHCYRCKTVIEPYLSEQWFVKMKPLAEPAIKAVREGRIKLVPKTWEKVYYEWMENIRDWCISRQLWWGHRIPVWYCRNCGHMNAFVDPPEKCEKCGSQDLFQDPDVLDTWFSSALWPFSTLGWPEKTPDLEYYYPTDLLVTGFDIIFFWVARMIMMGLKFMGDVPFYDVYIHALVRDEEGKKMSKSFGNVIDPLDMIEKYGADALRFTLASLALQGRDIKLSEGKIESSKNFANKIWNALRFILMNLRGFDPTSISEDALSLDLADRWILSRTQRIIKEVSELLKGYYIGESAKALYEFIWGEFCDWYIEISKKTLYDSSADSLRKESVRYVLWKVSSVILRLLHPYMPFVTEELWHRLPAVEGSIVVAPWPSYQEELVDEDAERKMRDVMESIRLIRNMRAEMGIQPGQKVKIVVKPHDQEFASLIRSLEGYFTSLASLSELSIDPDYERPKGCAVGVMNKAEIFMPLGEFMDLEKEISRLKREISDIEEDIQKVKTKLSNKAFLERAPREVVEKERKKLKGLEDRKERIERHLELLS